MPSKLYVGNLAYSVSNSDLEELFSRVGQVQSVAVITDKFSGQSKGFGFIEMVNDPLSEPYNATLLRITTGAT